MNSGGRHRWMTAARVAGLVASVLLVPCGCPMPFVTSLRAHIDELVEAAARGPQPEVSVFVADVEILDGGATDAFSPALQAQALDVVFTVRNGGIGDLVFREDSPVELSGADSALFSVLSPPSSATVASDSDTEFAMRFVMDSPGTKTAKINVYTNDADESPYEINISNTALPEIQVLRGAEEVLSGTGSCDFGATTYGSHTDVVLSINNLGKANLDLVGASPVTVSGVGFSVLLQPSSSVAPTESAAFTIRYLPAAPGAASGSVHIASNDTDENAFAFSVRGMSELPRSAVKIGAGGGFTVALKSDGTAWAWGANDYGQLGDGTITSRFTPMQVSLLTEAAATVPGGAHTVALKSDGTVWAWGGNTSGQLGDGTTTDRRAPVQVSGLAGVAVIAAGTYHSAALTSDGTVWAWGRNTDGQLGDGTTTPRTTPVQVSGLAGVTAIAAGGYHTVALKGDGTVWTWGDNSSGQLGDDSTTDRWTAGEVSGLAGVTAIAAGGLCTVALKSNGTVWAWGRNNYGQLGDGATVDRWAPVQVLGLTGVTAIAAGGYHTVALKGDGTVWTWGRNIEGQLGDGTTTPRTTPVQVSGLTGVSAIAAGTSNTAGLKDDGTVWEWGSIYAPVAAWTPVQVSALTGVADVAAGGNSTAALKSDGTVWAWGDNDYGQLGDGTTVDRWTAGEVSGLTGVTAIAAGGPCTVALKSNGTVWAWGRNNCGQLGDGTTVDRWTPVQVLGLTGVTAIATSGGHTVALKDDGTVWAWGSNSGGQLGIGTNEDSLTPVQVMGPDVEDWLTNVTAIAASGHTVALRGDGTVWAWGWNTSGQLGDGTTTRRTRPVQASGLAGVSAIAAGGNHTVALESGGTVRAWGQNNVGQLGDGTNTDRWTPVAVLGLAGMTAIAAGGYHTIALYGDEVETWAWGLNSSGQLGDGTTTNRWAPVVVPGLSGRVAIVAGQSHTVALMDDIRIWVLGWGSNSSGQLGDGTSGTNRLTPVVVVDPLVLW